MSIPKQPRQLMINIMYLVLTALLALNVSAEIFNAFKMVNLGLEQSNKTLDLANNSLPASIAERAKAKGISKVVFDRGGNIYHGRIAAIADAAREGGMDF